MRPTMHLRVWLWRWAFVRLARGKNIRIPLAGCTLLNWWDRYLNLCAPEKGDFL